MWRVPHLLIRLYQRWLSPLLPATCRFTPTCSHYAAEALKTHGFLRGMRLSLGRILRCHPFNPGGYDPVPSSAKHLPSVETGEPSHG